MPGSVFEPLDACMRCRCTTYGLECCETGFIKQYVSTPPPGCKVIKDNCDEFIVMEDNNSTDCFTGLQIQEVRRRNRMRNRIEDYLTNWSMQQLGMYGNPEGGPAGEPAGEAEYNPLMDINLMNMLFGNIPGRVEPLAADVPPSLLHRIMPGRSVAVSSLGGNPVDGNPVDFMGGNVNPTDIPGPNPTADTSGPNPPGIPIPTSDPMNMGGIPSGPTLDSINPTQSSLDPSQNMPDPSQSQRVDQGNSTGETPVGTGEPPMGTTTPIPGLRLVKLPMVLRGRLLRPLIKRLGGASLTDIQGQPMFKSRGNGVNDFLEFLAFMRMMNK
ncbi:hypothetical protein FSP39_020365 [Pinctada imbricata]|uniref:Uncharacterized protein n=1 Tax=Pinctada imbricata TaxID=66713 RepID=A0AA89BRL8_PINIB|nr:hypothetical protein FSP39_020365 [Pinctada imbricata]